MVSVNQAIKIVQDSIEPTTLYQQMKVHLAHGFVLFKDVISEINMPPFRQSAIDGYALNLHATPSYKIIDEVKAGDNHQPNLKKGEAVRIFTGAPVPDSANAVIMQERVNIVNESIIINTSISANTNIRPIGEQIKKDQVALKKGTQLTAAAIGFMASLGIENVSVYKKPSVAVVVTGNELIEGGNSLKYGQIYESNGIMLTSALLNLGYPQVYSFRVDDNYQNTLSVLKNVIDNHDMVIVSGGISVGDYDFVGRALMELDVEQLFHGVKQKPGKPLFFGKKDGKFVFALPGNPAAALGCFYIYVYPALQKMAGNIHFSVTNLKAKSSSNFVTTGDRSLFLKGIYTNGKVEILDGQASSMLKSFARANAFVFVSEHINSIKINDEVNVILFPIN